MSLIIEIKIFNLKIRIDNDYFMCVYILVLLLLNLLFKPKSNFNLKKYCFIIFLFCLGLLY